MGLSDAGLPDKEPSGTRLPLYRSCISSASGRREPLSTTMIS